MIVGNVLKDTLKLPPRSIVWVLVDNAANAQSACAYIESDARYNGKLIGTGKRRVVVEGARHIVVVNTQSNQVVAGAAIDHVICAGHGAEFVRDVLQRVEMRRKR